MLILEIVLWFIVAVCICMVAAKGMACGADAFFRAHDEEYRSQHARGSAPSWWPLWWLSIWQDLGLVLFAGVLILVILYLI